MGWLGRETVKKTEHPFAPAAWERGDLLFGKTTPPPSALSCITRRYPAE